MSDEVKPVNVFSAKKGDVVSFLVPDFDVVDDGTKIRMATAHRTVQVFTRRDLTDRLAALQAEVELVQKILAEADARGVA